MNDEEYNRLKELNAFCDASGNGDQDVDALQEYERSLEHKYNKDINQLISEYINRKATGTP